MHVPCQRKTCEKIFTFYIENAISQCRWGAVDPSASQN